MAPTYTIVFRIARERWRQSANGCAPLAPDRPQALAPVRKRMRTAGASPQTDAPGIDQDSGPGILV